MRNTQVIADIYVIKIFFFSLDFVYSISSTSAFNEKNVELTSIIMS